MKKVLLIVLAVAVVLTCLTGCKKEVSTNEKVDLLIGNPSGDALTPQAIVGNFKSAHPEINVTTDESAWNDFVTKIKLQFVSKADVVPVFVTDSANAASFGGQGSLADLKERVDKDLDASLYNKALFALTDKNGHLWGVPHAMNSIAMVYNQEVFDKYNVPYPTEDWTWQDMFDIAEKLTIDENGDGVTDVYGISYSTNITQGWLPFMAAVGCDIYGENRDRSNLSDPKAKEAYLKYMEPIEKGWVPDAAFMATYGHEGLAMIDGKIAMILCQSSMLKTINSNAPEGFRYDAQMMPIGWNGQRKCVYVPNVWVMYSGADEKVKDAAWEWIKFYMSEESQMIVANEGPAGYPIMKSALDVVAKNGVMPEHKDAFFKGIDDYGISLLENPVSSAANGVLNELTAKIKNKEIKRDGLDKALADYDKQLQDEFDFYYKK